MFKTGDFVMVINGPMAGAVGQVVEIMEEAIAESAQVLIDAMAEQAPAAAVADAPAPAAPVVPGDLPVEAQPAPDVAPVADVLAAPPMDVAPPVENAATTPQPGLPGQVKVHISGVVNGVEIHGDFWFNPEDLAPA